MSRTNKSQRIRLWLDRLNRFAESGLKVAEFCQREQVSVPSFYQWKRQLIDIPDSEKTCPIHGDKVLLPEWMWDIREKLVTIPARFEVLHRKYMADACPGCPECGITSPERPTGIVEGDKYDTSVATQIITHKYAYFMTLYRLQNLFAGSGWTPSRGLMLNILQGCHFIIDPLLDCFKQTLLQDRTIACDDTGTTLLYPKVPPDFDLGDPKQARAAEVYAAALAAGKPSINAKMWVYRGVKGGPLLGPGRATLGSGRATLPRSRNKVETLHLDSVRQEPLPPECVSEFPGDTGKRWQGTRFLSPQNYLNPKLDGFRATNVKLKDYPGRRFSIDLATFLVI